MKKILVLTMAFLVFGTMSYAQSRSAQSAMKKQQLAPNAQIKDAKTGAVLKTVKPAKEVTLNTPTVKMRTPAQKSQSNKMQNFQQPERFPLGDMSLKKSGSVAPKPTSTNTATQGSGAKAKSNQAQAIQQPKTFSNQSIEKKKNANITPKTAKKSGKSIEKSGKSIEKLQIVQPVKFENLNDNK